jgi:hypothetical protein
MLTVWLRSLKRLSEIAERPDPTRRLSYRDNRLLFAFWTCLQLERYVAPSRIRPTRILFSPAAPLPLSHGSHLKLVPDIPANKDQ